MLEMLKYLFHKNVDSPIQLIHFVTTECNLRCSHCFIFGEDAKYRNKNVLSLEEIEKITLGLGKEVHYVSLTGGEPMLREDLPEIAKMYRVNAGVRSIVIPTNGTLTEQCVRTTSKIIRENPDLDLSVSISLDNLYDRHDRIRNMEGAFARTIETCKALEGLAKSRLSLNIGITVSSYNETDLEDLLLYIARTIPYASVSVIAARGNPLDKESKDFDAENFRKISKLAESSMLTGATRRSFNNLKNGGILLSAKNLIRYKIIYNTLKHPRFYSPCYSGRLLAVLLPDGDVYPCEPLETKMGNIREWDYDFTKLWRSPQANKVRNHIEKSRCFCTWECTMTHNILFNPRFYPDLAFTCCRILATRFYSRLFYG